MTSQSVSFITALAHLQCGDGCMEPPLCPVVCLFSGHPYSACSRREGLNRRNRCVRFFLGMHRENAAYTDYALHRLHGVSISSCRSLQRDNSVCTFELVLYIQQKERLANEIQDCARLHERCSPINSCTPRPYYWARDNVETQSKLPLHTPFTCNGILDRSAGKLQHQACEHTPCYGARTACVGNPAGPYEPLHIG